MLQELALGQSLNLGNSGQLAVEKSLSSMIQKGQFWFVRPQKIISKDY
jgi:hypothetical protein